MSDLLERVARRVAARIYRCSWDELPEGDRRSCRVLAQQRIEDVTAELDVVEQPPPFTPDPDLIDNNEGNTRIRNHDRAAAIRYLEENL